MSFATRRKNREKSRQGLLTILFTDLEDSTAMTQRLGDARAQEVVRAHNTIVRREVRERGGTEIKHTGDGIMATFPSAARAVAAAVAMQQATRAYNDLHPETSFNIAVGLNAGEPVSEDADVFGSAVQMAARTCAEAHGGQILATNVVRELVYGKGALFEDMGSSELKGFSEAVHLYEVGVSANGIDEGLADYGQQRPLPWLPICGAAVVLIAIAVGVVLFTQAGGSDSSGSQPSAVNVPYAELRIQIEATTKLEVVGGDCATADLVLRGATSGPVRGGFAGELAAESNIVQPVAEDCQSVVVTGPGRVSGGADVLLFANHLRARPRVGRFETGDPDAVPNALEGTDIWVLAGGEGRFAGATGAGRCELAGLSLAGIDATSQLNCTLRVAVGSPFEPVTMEADSTQPEVAAGVSQAANAETEIFVIYRNNTDGPLTGLTLGLGAVDGARLTAAPSGEEPQPVSATTRWALPDLPAGEVGRLRLRLRVQSADAAQIKLVPNITAEGLEDVAKSSPVSITVVK